MLENLFITTVIIGVVMTIYAHEKDSIMYSIFSAVFWLIVMANTLYIQVSFSTTDKTYMELGFNAMCLFFIFMNIAQAILLYYDWIGEGRVSA